MFDGLIDGLGSQPLRTKQFLPGLKWRVARDTSDNFLIQYSTNGGTWTTINSFGPTGVDTFQANSTKLTFSDAVIGGYYTFHTLASATAPTTTNYTLASNGADLFLNGPTTSINLDVAGAVKLTATVTGMTAFVPFTTGALITGVPLAKVGGSIFDFIATVSTTNTNGTEDDLFTRTLPANTLMVVSQKLFFQVGLNVIGSATATRNIKVYYGGTLIFTTGAIIFATTGAVEIFATGIVVDATGGASKVRWIVTLTTQTGAALAYVQYTEVTGLTLSATQILKCTGIAAGTGAASGDISATLGTIGWAPAA